ncbi:MAG: SDR family oxidoreductase [Gammaproteobacteria bacterium]|nr:SDR family oxidoreductase [Gammaproteobacteria bacterium]
MKDKIVLITGGSRGIGASTALLAAKSGWNVCISYINQQASAASIVNEIKYGGNKAIAVKANIGSEQEIMALFEKIDAEFGRLDALVNNAGIITPIAQLVEMDAARLQSVFNINVVGTFLCTREAIKRMSTKKNGNGGSIVNVSSAAARIGSPNEFIDYAASKGAIDSMTLGLSKEIAAEGIRVNAVRPGLINTELHADTGEPDRVEKLENFIPMKRPGSADEVAKAIVWLMSDDASYVNGALLDVAGGR